MIYLVLSCQKNKKRQENIKNTWAKNLSNVYFIEGNHIENKIEHNMVYLTVKDDYLSLPLKQIFAIQLIYNTFRQPIFTCDDDTFVVPERLEKINFNNIDYLGSVVLNPINNIHFVYGGSGIYLSEKACEKFEGLQEKHIINSLCPPWADAIIGNWMFVSGISPVHNDDFDRGEYENGPQKLINLDGILIEEKQNGYPLKFPNENNTTITSHFWNL